MKRKNESKDDLLPHKKIKAVDLPSSNWDSQKANSQSNYSSTRREDLVSLPQYKPTPEVNVSQVIDKMVLPGKYKEALGFNKDELKKYAQMKAKREIMMTKIAKPNLLVPEPEKKPEKEKDHTGISMDEHGRMRDKEGHLVTLKSKANLVAINQNKEKREKRAIKGYGVSELKESSIFDPSLRLGNLHRREKKKSYAFHFVEAEHENKIVGVKYYDPIPSVEWWDSGLLLPKAKNYLFFDSGKMMKNRTMDETIEEIQNNIQALEEAEISESHFRKVEYPLFQAKINSRIEHPVPFKPITGDSNVPLPMYLTKQERKKLKRQKKAEKLKEFREKQMLGLVTPPPPKVKLSNMMRILGNEAVIDPSQTEEVVRKQIQERLQAHLTRNEERKLDKAGKLDKTMRRLKRDAAREIRVAVFKAPQGISPKHKFKIDKNAQQFSLTGVCLMSPSGSKFPSLVIVEGGARAVKTYKKLMLRRIKWDLDMEDIAANSVSSASLVWEASLLDRSFKRWSVSEMKSELDGRKILEERRLVTSNLIKEHLWEMVADHN